jgi:TonB family protein
MLMMILIIFVFFTGTLWPSPDVVAQLRLYEGFKVETAAPAKVITSYYLKPISDEDVFLDVDISKEMASLKRVFNLKEIKLMTQAGMVLEKESAKSPFQVIVLNGRKLLLQLSSIEEKKNRFKVEVLEKGEKIRSLLETKIFLPEKKTTVLGFEDSSKRIYFLSFHRGKDVPSEPGKPINIKSIESPKLIKSPPPKYPEAAIKAGIQGKVVINATIDVEGRVVDTQVIDGPQELREVAQEAIKQWQYEPYYLDGVARAVKFTVIVKFNLDKKKDQKPISLSTDQKPKLVKRVDPKYPEEAIKAEIQGNVVIEATTDTKGHVLQAKVIEGHPMLNTAALEAIKQWQYEVYYLEGEPTPVTFTVVMKFNLDKKKTKEKDEK